MSAPDPRRYPRAKMHDLRKRTGSVDIDAPHHGGFRGILERHDESLPAAALGFQVLPDIGRGQIDRNPFPYGQRKTWYQWQR